MDTALQWRFVTNVEFRTALASLPMSQRGFAEFTGSNERSVRRWASGSREVPAWVPVMLGLMRDRRGAGDFSVAGEFSGSDPA